MFKAVGENPGKREEGMKYEFLFTSRSPVTVDSYVGYPVPLYGPEGQSITPVRAEKLTKDEFRVYAQDGNTYWCRRRPVDAKVEIFQEAGGMKRNSSEFISDKPRKKGSSNTDDVLDYSDDAENRRDNSGGQSNKRPSDYNYEPPKRSAPKYAEKAGSSKKSYSATFRAVRTEYTPGQYTAYQAELDTLARRFPSNDVQNAMNTYRDVIQTIASQVIQNLGVTNGETFTKQRVQEIAIEAQSILWSNFGHSEGGVSSPMAGLVAHKKLLDCDTSAIALADILYACGVPMERMNLVLLSTIDPVTLDPVTLHSVLKIDGLYFESAMDIASKKLYRALGTVIQTEEELLSHYSRIERDYPIESERVYYINTYAPYYGAEN